MVSVASLFVSDNNDNILIMKNFLVSGLLCVATMANAQTYESLTFSTGFETIKMICVEGGQFQMGSTLFNDAQPVHSVSVATFYMAETEVTNAVWADVYGDDGFDTQEKDDYGRTVDDNAAKGRISYTMAVDFVNRLNTLLANQLPSGCYFAIPTEAQWEYAARGGANHDDYAYSGGNTANVVAVWGGATEKPVDVKTKAANSLGIYDMSGNAIEWCTDEYAYGYDAEPSQYSVKRIQRGGGVHSRNEKYLNVAYRDGQTETSVMWYFGLRLVLNMPVGEEPAAMPVVEVENEQSPRLVIAGGSLSVRMSDGRLVDLCGREM